MLRYPLFDHMATQKHLLIAGASGSGKSVLLNGLIYNLLFESPHDVQFIMIDVKRVELIDYINCPHVIRYADTTETAIQALETALRECLNRFQYMQDKHLKMFDGSHLYVIIDELADLMTTAQKQVTPILQRICQLGRAARVHTIVCTQCPLASIIPTCIKVNYDSRVGLHTSTKQDSRNIIEQSGLESVQVGNGFYRYPGNDILVKIPYVTQQQIDEMVAYWEYRKPRKTWFKRLFR